MPGIAIGVSLLLGAAGGFVLAKGTDELGSAVKWVVIGGAVYVAGKRFGAW